MRSIVSRTTDAGPLHLRQHPIDLGGLTMTAPLIGMIGRRRSGKDSVAETLVSEFGYARVAFADPLKEAALTVDPIVGVRVTDAIPHALRLSTVVDEIGWEAAKDSYPTEARGTALQRLGDAVRNLDADFWVRAAMSRVTASDAPVIVTDCRFPNEAEAIRLAGGIIVRVVRPGAVADPGVDSHPSETALDDYPEDFYVDNSGTLDELAADVRELLGLIA
jgi:hypothetical protein